MIRLQTTVVPWKLLMRWGGRSKEILNGGLYLSAPPGYACRQSGVTLRVLRLVHRFVYFTLERFGMPEGTIKRLTQKGFGFIDTGTEKDLFFHMSNVEGTQYDSLQEGQRVSFNEGQGPKGPRAENVRVL